MSGFTMCPEFYKLGLGDPYPISAVNGYGTGDLLDEVVKTCRYPSRTRTSSMRFRSLLS